MAKSFSQLKSRIFENCDNDSSEVLCDSENQRFSESKIINTPYVSPQTFCENFSVTTENNLSFLHLNIRSMKKILKTSKISFFL